jgi:hypothetical protein
MATKRRSRRLMAERSIMVGSFILYELRPN